MSAWETPEALAERMGWPTSVPGGSYAAVRERDRQIANALDELAVTICANSSSDYSRGRAAGMRDIAHTLRRGAT